ncbi:MAG: glycosyltransferase family 39 protein [Pseudomonadota bacterium]
MHTPVNATYSRSAIFFFAALAVLLVMRVAGIMATPLNLGPDEAQYWRWAQDPAWGYYSKPPMIAWVIAATTAIFGNAEWAVRLAAPVLHGVAATALFGLGRAMYGDRAGLLAGLGYLLMPGVVLSSAVISTDGVLLPFWSMALYCFWRLRSETGGWASAVTLGICVGIGFLAKYAMLYFAVGTALAIISDPPSRKALLTLKGGAALALTLSIFAPHLVWNAANEFQTVGHTVDNANLGGPLFNPENAGKFLTDQMGVFGPISFLALLFGGLVMRRSDGEGVLARDRWLLGFIVPVLVIILVQAVISRAHANWAATAYPAASVLVAAWMTRAGPAPRLWVTIAVITFLAALFIPDMALIGRLTIGTGIAGTALLFGWLFSGRPEGLLWAGMSIHAVLAVAFTAVAVGPVGWSEQLGLTNAFKRTRGWQETSTQVLAAARAANATAILVDERENWHGLDYYLKDEDHPPLISWRRYNGVKSFAESRPLTDDIDDRVLVVSMRPIFRPRMRADFDQFSASGSITIALGGDRTRDLKVYLASEFDPLPRDSAWEARFEGLSED